MKIVLQKGDYLWSYHGTHVCDETGIALKATHTVEVEIENKHLERVLPILKQARINDGLIVDFGLSNYDYGLNYGEV